MSEEKKQPIISVRAGEQQISVWENTHQRKDGSGEFKKLTATLRRGYPEFKEGKPVLDGEGKQVWKEEVIHMNRVPQDFQKLRVILEEATKQVILRE